MRHKHHIVPKHAGGSDDSSNIIELTVEEHAEAHRLLWEQNRNLADFVAWKMLSGKTKEAERARIEMAKAAFKDFLRSNRKESWKKNISESLAGKKQTPESNAKRSDSMKKAYAEGKRDCWFRYADKSFFQSNYDSERMALGRKKSETWKLSVTSDEYRRKRAEQSPKAKKIRIDGVEYPSIRSAAKAIGMPYSRLRSLLNGDDFFSLNDV